MGSVLNMTPQSAGQLIKKSESLVQMKEIDQDDRRTRTYQLSQEGMDILMQLKEVLESSAAQEILR